MKNVDDDEKAVTEVAGNAEGGAFALSPRKGSDGNGDPDDAALRTGSCR